MQDEEEGSLLLVTITLTRPEVNLTLGSVVEAISFRAEIELKEEKVYTHLDKEKERDAGTWVPDTGATNHNGKPCGGDDVFMMEYTTLGHAALETKRGDEESAEQSMLPAMNDDAEVDNDINNDNLDTDHNNVEVDDDIDDDNLDADHDDDVLLHFLSINNIFGIVGFAPCELVVEELHMVSSNESASFAKAEHSPS
jgi:hypothetical protein